MAAVHTEAPRPGATVDTVKARPRGSADAVITRPGAAVDAVIPGPGAAVDAWSSMGPVQRQCPRSPQNGTEGSPGRTFCAPGSLQVAPGGISRASKASHVNPPHLSSCGGLKFYVLADFKCGSERQGLPSQSSPESPGGLRGPGFEPATVTSMWRVDVKRPGGLKRPHGYPMCPSRGGSTSFHASRGGSQISGPPVSMETVDSSKSRTPNPYSRVNI